MKTDDELKVLTDEELKEEEGKTKKEIKSLEENQAKTDVTEPLPTFSHENHEIKHWEKIERLKKYLKRIENELSRRITFLKR